MDLRPSGFEFARVLRLSLRSAWCTAAALLLTVPCLAVTAPAASDDSRGERSPRALETQTTASPAPAADPQSTESPQHTPSASPSASPTATAPDRTDSPAPRPNTPEAQKAPGSHYERVGLIGASATAGFGVRVDAVGEDGVSREIHAADLGDVFLAASQRPVTISRFASLWFFNDPLSTGRGAIDRMLAFKPTCVFAVDFLFWYGYGSTNAQGRRLENEEQRLGLLEVGLSELDRIVKTGIPVVVGDFPNMEASVGRMLRAEQLPKRETLERLNARLHEWAKTRPNVRVLPLSTLVPSLETGQSVDIRGRAWSKANDGELIQRDRLHPTFAGAMAMLAKACELMDLCVASDGDGNTSSATVETTVTVCDETLCFEPVKLRERFIQQVREGRRRSAPNDAGPPQPSNAE
ncbi:MAG: hypothetical protein KF724_08465 [Phycisphaeraceae bacterium]|nr:hypothetical protein [Phycisphaeraceae bacterium]